MELLAIKRNKESPVSVPSMNKERVQEDTVVEKWKERNLMEFSSARLSSDQFSLHTVFFFCFLNKIGREKNNKNENV